MAALVALDLFNMSKSTLDYLEEFIPRVFGDDAKFEVKLQTYSFFEDSYIINVEGSLKTFKQIDFYDDRGNFSKIETLDSLSIHNYRPVSVHLIKDEEKIFRVKYVVFDLADFAEKLDNFSWATFNQEFADKLDEELKKDD